MPAGIAAPLLRKYIVARVSVAKERCPVDPTVTGSACAKYAETDAATLLHVAATVVTVTAPVSGTSVTTNPLLMTPVVARSGEMNAASPAAGGVASTSRLRAYPLPPQLEEYVDWAELIARSDPIADASLPDIRARSRPGTAIAAMMPMIATTISSSISVKPPEVRILIGVYLSVREGLHASSSKATATRIGS